jgi:hypothetical protein
MANYYFQRDTKVFIHVPTSAAGTKAMYYELPVLDGYSFSQATNTSEITLNQAQTIGGVSLRARQMFNDSYAPAEWSFSTYMSPFQGVTDQDVGTQGAAAETVGFHQEVSEALWAMFFGQMTSNALTADTNNLTVNQDQANKATVGVFDLYFVFGGANMAYTAGLPANFTGDNVGVYKIEDCSVNEFSFDFDIDGIATVAWSGQGKIITDEGTKNFSTAPEATTTITEGVVSATGAARTNGFIRNRVSDLTLTPASLNSGTAYATTLTGGNITGTNNLTYLTPETLGVVNQPLGHVTGTKSIGGNVTCYLDNASNASADLFEDVIEATSDIQNSLGFAFDIGAGSGATADTVPYCLITLPTCHVEVPTINIEDVISLETNFHALPSAIDNTNEISVFDFYGITVG